MALFSEILVSVICGKHHGHPIVAGVTSNLFRATATYTIHIFYISCRVHEGQAKACRTRQKTDMV